MCAALSQLFTLSSCNNDEKQAEEARMNAAVTAKLGDMMKDDYEDAATLIASKGVCVKTDIFGDEHVFKDKEKAFAYIASINRATFDVMDSLSLSVEAVALSQPEDENLKKLNSLLKKYVSLCKNPNAADSDLIAACKSVSADIAQAVTEGGAPNAEKLQIQTALAGNAIMQKEIVAAQIATERNNQAAQIHREEGKAFLEENAKKEGVVTLPSGLQYRVIKKGTGVKPNDESQVTVAYEGRFIDGKVFDGTDKNNGGKPVTLGMRSVVRGWNEALKLMKKGSEWEIYLPYELGYGEEGLNDVPPFAALVFRIKLVDVK